MAIKVAITDDHPLAINGISTMLSEYSQIQITETYNSGTALIEGLTNSQPDVLLLDIHLPDKPGSELAPIIIKKYPHVHIVVLTSLDAPAIVTNMMKHGCLGYLLKGTDKLTLLTAIEHAARGDEFIEPHLKEHLLHYMFNSRKSNNPLHPDITTREKEILQLIVEEYTTQEIADRLYISFRTVETHRYSLLQKLNVKNSAGLVRMAIVLNLVDYNLYGSQNKRQD